MTMKPSVYRETLRKEWRRGSFWRDILAEFVGTFMLMTVQSALPLSWGKENMGTVVQVALFMGFVVTTAAWSLGDFSGGHLNPAVTFAMMLLAKITFIKAIFYIGIQCAAGVAGAAFINAVTPANLTESLAATMLHPDLQAWQGVLVEMWITFMLVLTVLGSTNSLRKRPLYTPPLFIGMAVAMGIASGFNSTGGSMNPARSLGPAAVMALVNGQDMYWENHWVYWAGPFAGAALAAIIYSGFFDQIDRPEVEDDDGGYNFPISNDKSLFMKNNPAYVAD